MKKYGDIIFFTIILQMLGLVIININMIIDAFVYVITNCPGFFFSGWIISSMIIVVISMISEMIYDNKENQKTFPKRGVLSSKRLRNFMLEQAGRYHYFIQIQHVYFDWIKFRSVNVCIHFKSEEDSAFALDFYKFIIGMQQEWRRQFPDKAVPEINYIALYQSTTVKDKMLVHLENILILQQLFGMTKRELGDMFATMRTEINNKQREKSCHMSHV